MIDTILIHEASEPQGFGAFDNLNDIDEDIELTEEEEYNLIPECPMCGCLQGAENIKICKKHQIELLTN